MDDDKSKKLQNTSELLGDLDDLVAEYNFSIDDILAEFGVERSEPEPEEVVEPEQVSEKTEDEAVTEVLRGTLEEMRLETEREQLQKIEAETAVQTEDKVHVFEQVGGETESVKHRGRRKHHEPTEDGEGEAKKIITRETDDLSKVFGDDFEKYFGEDTSSQARKRQRRKHKSEKELEKELFGGEAPIIPGSPDRTPINELSEEDIPVTEKASELVAVLGRSHVRIAAAAMVAVLLAFVTFAPQLGIELPAIFMYRKTPYIYLPLVAAMQVAVMLLCYETTVVGARGLFTLKPNMESVVVFAGFASLIHLVTIVLFPTWGGYLPFVSITSVSHLCAAYFTRRETLAKLKSCKTANGVTRPYIACREPLLYDGNDGIIKYRANEPRYFVNQLEKPDIVRRTWSIASPIIIVGSIAVAAVAAISGGRGTSFPWTLAAVTAASAPFSLLLPYCLTFAKTARRLGMGGSAIAGWAACEAFGEASDIVLTDFDIFPPGTVSLGGLKVYGGEPVDRVITYAASLIGASGAGTARPFMDLLGEQSAKPRKVNAFKFYENGGIGGEIDGRAVLAGTAAFMMRTGIKIPQDVGGKPMIFIAVNQELAGIFVVNYSTSPQVENAIKSLLKHGVTPIFAVRDFNITSAMIDARFKLSTDTVDFPKIEDRLALSDADRLYFAKPSAVISREGLNHYAEAIIAAKNLRRVTRLCMVLTLISTILGMAVMFYLAFVASPQTATPVNVMLYMLISFVPVWLASKLKL